MTNNAAHKVTPGDTVIVNRHTHGVKLGVAVVTAILPGDEVNLIVHDPRGTIPLENVPWTESESGDGWMTREQAAPFFAAQRQQLTPTQGPPPTHPSGYRDAPVGSDPRTTPQSLPQISAASTRPLPGMTSASAERDRDRERASAQIEGPQQPTGSARPTPTAPTPSSADASDPTKQR